MMKADVKRDALVRESLLKHGAVSADHFGRWVVNGSGLFGLEDESGDDLAGAYKVDTTLLGVMVEGVWLAIYNDYGIKATDGSQLFRHLSRSTSDTIRLLISSPGGMVTVGDRVVGAIRAQQAQGRRFEFTAVGGVYSMATTILAQARKGVDIVSVSPMIEVMIHRASACFCGDALAFERAAKMLIDTDSAAVEVYAQRLALSREDILSAMTATTFYNAEDALRIGFADAVMSNAPQAPAPSAAEGDTGGVAESGERMMSDAAGKVSNSMPLEPRARTEVEMRSNPPSAFKRRVIFGRLQNDY